MNRRMYLTFLLAALGLMQAVGGDALAQEPPVPPAPPAAVTGPVTLEILCVRATKSNDHIDPELQPLIEQLALTSYTGFGLLDSRAQSVAVGDDTTVSIEGGRRLEVKVVDRDDVLIVPITVRY